jgi:hypothetical protein
MRAYRHLFKTLLLMLLLTHAEMELLDNAVLFLSI